MLGSLVQTGDFFEASLDEHTMAAKSRILIADDNPENRDLLDAFLASIDCEIEFAVDGRDTLDKVKQFQPHLILLDVMMPKLDGFEVCRRLRSDARTNSIPVIMLTAKDLTVDKVVGLTAGADDYIIKPFDTLELHARVRTTLRRARELRESSPLTGLPGNHAITVALSDWLHSGRPLAVVYADLNDFKPYNDRYGFVRGDDVIMMTAEVLQEAVLRHGSDGSFVGHIGGDDFMFACEPDDIVAICNDVIAEFEARLPHFYDADDYERGYVDLPDRQGDVRRFRRVSIALGVASTAQRRFRDHRELVEVATEMKGFLKRQERRSAFAIDGRTDDDGGLAPDQR
jgi:PleD family two-component response regulator